MRSRSEILESVEKIQAGDVLSQASRWLSGFSSLRCITQCSTQQAAAVQPEPRCYSDDLPGPANGQGTAETNSLKDWQVERFSQSLLPNKPLGKKSASSSLKKIGLCLQEVLSAIKTLISSANNKILHNLIMYFFPLILGKAYAKQIVCEIFFAHPQHRILSIWKHRKDCQGLKSSCFHSSFRFQINS